MLPMACPLSGVGYGIIFGPCMVVVGQFFNKRRSLANGLAAAGGSLGQLCIPMLITVMLKEYGFHVRDVNLLTQQIQ